jgi:hypothetical protein
LVGDHVNKSDLIDAIARHADISKAAAGRALDALTKLDHRHFAKRRFRHPCRIRFVPRRQADGATGTQSANRRRDTDRRGQSAEVSALARPSRML